MIPTYRLECQKCGDFQEMSEWPMIGSGAIRWAPSEPTGLRYIRCECGWVSRWEVAPNMTLQQILSWWRRLKAWRDRRTDQHQHREAA